MSSPLSSTFPILPGPVLPSWLGGLLCSTHDVHHSSASTNCTPSRCGGEPGSSTIILLRTRGWLGLANAQLHLYRGPARGWAGDKSGFALAQDVLEAASCSARGGFWVISHAYPSYGTGERWKFKQAPQPCELALCRAVPVQLTARNPSDL